jgi:hypothetical protein
LSYRTAPNAISFQTAWCPVPKVISALSRKYPDVELLYSHADENIGAQVGTTAFKNGWMISATIPKAFSKEAYEMVFALHGVEPKEFNFRLMADGSNYEYVDDEDEIAECE